MGAKHARKRARGRVFLAAAVVGLVAITAVVVSSGAGAAPFIPVVPGYRHPVPTEATVQLDDLKFPLGYASEAINSAPGTCAIGALSCKTAPEPFTLTKPVDSATPVLAQSAASGRPFTRAVITVRTEQNGQFAPLITYTLENVRVLDDHQVYENHQEGGGTVREVVTLRYQRIEWQVGDVKAGRDFGSNTNF